MECLSSLYTCCGLFGKKSQNGSSSDETAKGCTNNGQQAMLDSTTTTLDDSKFDVISPDNSLLQVKLETPNTPQTPQSIEIEPSQELVNSIEDDSIQVEPATVVANDRPKKKGKKKILRRILTLSTSKKRTKLVNVSSTEN